MGPNLLALLSHFWNNLFTVPRQGGFYGRPIRVERGVTQGDPLSPIIFNIVVDAVVRAMRAHPRLVNIKALFYADDGLIVGSDWEEVQLGVDTLTDLFRRMGLHMNAGKTKALLSHPEDPAHSISTPVFTCCLTRGKGNVFRS